MAVAAAAAAAPDIMTLEVIACLPCAMPAFVYRCPNTGFNVQGWVADDPTEREGETYQSITCTICTRVHLIDPKTGKVLGADEN